ncbi:Flp pilus assembly protein CpaB [Sulfitobacter donghicola]|uniref:Pilus assembly protein CpaB n=1 Tax=Sulfitobacter donghicola DSW-25 = KCTC 12864 = JCM 14565 TaxID=1300350 RepID=A0A073IFA4_9RHOB|nr:Flp pilus assembly protein CpaB [Sulfitobacter donghicola]KEJ88255.1 pilus assembly protein CpaB [Sulfitobacter donghicola DSW-25 = KCTC 12864 = JCM 14565]KIN68850.1 Pilus assembly domain protein [Sulfitobacter donghicola DSW-25 = KCTC 12864 = JCM 14565]
MRMIFGLVLLVGIALAGGAVYLAKGQIGQYKTAIARAEAAKAQIVPTQKIFVVNRALKYGEKLAKEDVREVDFPKAALPEGHFTDIASIFPENTDKPRVVLRPIEKDEALLAVKITKPGEDAGLTSRLEKGMRAFAIKVDVSSGVSGFLRPGDRVDIYWTGRAGGGQSRNDVTKIIEASVPLIAVDQRSGDLEGTQIARTVTVAVNPNQVASLAQAQSSGRLSLSLVGAGDDIVTATNIEVNQQDLLGIAPQVAAPVAKEEKVCTIRTRRGAEVVNLPIPCTN